ncbi:uncharacterized protein LOC134259242 [Saccostrea cucullata]|uniref:uncharacterized protein LOC134259242 n=1 Tax=Saccostrea cuccullata TaxID=36930 RepID=UPI002ED1C12A
MADKENQKLKPENMDETQKPKLEKTEGNQKMNQEKVKENKKPKQKMTEENQKRNNEKAHEKGNCTLMILTGAIMVVAVVLVSSCDVTKRSKSCDLKEAVEYLRLNFTVSCKYENSKDIKQIWRIGISALVLDFVFLFLSLILLMIPGERHRTAYMYLACYTVLALQSIVLSVLLFLGYNNIVDSKTTKKDTDYGKLKSAMNQSLTENFTSDVISINDSTSDRWNNFFIKYDCCAVNQVISTTNDFDTSPWCTTSGSCQLTNSQIPKSCCKAYTIYDYQSAPEGCHARVEERTYRDSCFSRVLMLDDFAITDDQIDVIATISLTLGILKVCAVILAVWIVVGLCIYICKKTQNCKTNHSDQCLDAIPTENQQTA